MGKSRGNLARLALVSGLLVAAGVIALAVESASAGFSSGCTATGTSEFAVDPDGTSIKVTVGFKDTGMVNDGIGERHNTAGKHGEPWDSESACFLSAGQTFNEITVLLGDKADSLRMDARKPKPLSVPDPLPKSVRAIVQAGKGNDVVAGHKGIDEIYGEGGADHIDINQGGADNVDCGGGSHDVVRADANDMLSRCETVK
jgi:Ca2+-binding RTX toxin-like protein